MRLAVVLTAALQHLAYLNPTSDKLQLVSLAAWTMLWACAGGGRK